jgi:hypothetical protein
MSASRQVEEARGDQPEEKPVLAQSIEQLTGSPAALSVETITGTVSRYQKQESTGCQSKGLQQECCQD